MTNRPIEIRVETWDLFAPVYRRFEEFISSLRATSVIRLHNDVEEQILGDTRELHRLAYQAHLDSLSAAERVTAERAGREAASGEAGAPVTRGRDIESMFGTVRLKRLGYEVAEAPETAEVPEAPRSRRMRFPLDAKLGLPPQKYSLSLQRHAVEEARVQSMAEASKRVDRTTGGHVPLRQLEESVVRAAVDFDAFYEQASAPSAERTAISPSNEFEGPPEPVPMMVLSTDASGVVVIDEALRDSTRKAREEAQSEAVRGDPMAPPKKRRFNKRMAQVTGVWDQRRQVRTPESIVAHMRDESKPTTKMPKPENKRITASLEQSAKARIDELFAEADRRDPTRARETAVLIDGAEHQRDLVEAAAKEHARPITIVLDIIHALHYLWLAGNALCNKDKVLTAAWVEDYLEKLLTRPLQYVVAGIRQAATLRELEPAQLVAVEKCAVYLLKNAPYVRYAEFLARGLPIATGVIEGACRHLCHDRLDITGARWSITTAEAILRIRALHTNGDWDEYWSFHVRQELLRNHGPANDQQGLASAA